jgi:hypothetical protein
MPRRLVSPPLREGDRPRAYNPIGKRSNRHLGFLTRCEPEAQDTSTNGWSPSRGHRSSSLSVPDLHFLGVRTLRAEFLRTDTLCSRLT